MAPHWTLAWLGRPWVAGEYECTDFVEEVLAAEFGHGVALPRGSIRDAEGLIAAGTGVIAAPTDTPAEGDGVLMRSLGRRRSIGYHIGVWTAPVGRPHVLHCRRVAGACLDEIAALAMRGFAYMGAYRWL